MTWKDWQVVRDWVGSSEWWEFPFPEMVGIGLVGVGLAVTYVVVRSPLFYVPTWGVVGLAGSAVLLVGGVLYVALKRPRS